MQLYQVSFQVHYANIVDKGSVILCADNNEVASQMVIELLELPPTLTQCEVKRVKPNLFLVDRHEIQKPKPSPKMPAMFSAPTPQQLERAYRPSSKGLLAVQKQVAEKRERQREKYDNITLSTKYECHVLATVTAADENVALARIGQHLRDRSNGSQKQDPHVTRVSIDLVPHSVVREVA